jgi:Pyruvate/2-oxoacid:ferredoxin oxidoreductase gamma subunit
VAQSAGAAYVRRCSSYQTDLPQLIADAIAFDGFAVVDIWGICTGRYTRHNRLSPQRIATAQKALPPADGVVAANQRPEYGGAYRQMAAQLDPVTPPMDIRRVFDPLIATRTEIMLMGDAGQRIITAGEILCLAGMTGGLAASQKNEYNITVLRGPSISEVILTPGDIGYTGIARPQVILALSQEGINRRAAVFRRLDDSTIIYHVPQVMLPPTKAKRFLVDFKAQKIKSQDWALAGLALLATQNRIISMPMLKEALAYRFKADVLNQATALIESVTLPDR